MGKKGYQCNHIFYTNLNLLHKNRILKNSIYFFIRPRLLHWAVFRLFATWVKIPHSIVVSTLDFPSVVLGSNPDLAKHYLLFNFNQIKIKMWRKWQSHELESHHRQNDNLHCAVSCRRWTNKIKYSIKNVFNPLWDIC